MASPKVAVVTGSNKGIGLETVRRLCTEFPGDVFLTARNKELGLAAVETLRKEGLSPKFHQLDIEDKQSVENLRDFLSQQYGGLDVLVNNAAICYPLESNTTLGDEAVKTMAVNFDGTLTVCEMLFPLLRPHARVVNVSTRGANMVYGWSGEAVKKRIRSCTTVEEVRQLMADYVKSVQTGKHSADGFHGLAYGMSKLGVILVTKMQQQQLEKDSRTDIIVNSCCPGLVKTDLNSNNPHGKSVNEGAEMPVYLSLLPENVKSPRGQFIAEREHVDYTTHIDPVPPGVDFTKYV